jgi:hypothetical protein
LAAFDDANLLHAGVDAVDDATVEGESNGLNSNTVTTNFGSWDGVGDGAATNITTLAMSWSEFCSEPSENDTTENSSTIPSTLTTLFETGSVLSTLQTTDTNVATAAADPSEAAEDAGQASGDSETEPNAGERVVVPTLADAVPRSTLDDYNANGGHGEFQPARTDNFTDTTIVTICSPSGGGTGIGGDTCTDSEASSTHTITQVYTDADHWTITETIVASYNITREAPHLERSYRRCDDSRSRDTQCNDRLARQWLRVDCRLVDHDGRGKSW